MASIKALEIALVNADKAGDTDAARKLAAVIKRSREQAMSPLGIPTAGEEGPQAIPKPAPEPTIGEQVLGAGEAALALGTGATTGALGFVGGTAKGMAQQILAGEFGTPQAAQLIQQEAMKGTEALTYAPRTQAGQEITQAVAETLQPLEAIAPLGGQMAAISGGARPKVSIPKAQPKPSIKPAVGDFSSETITARYNSVEPTAQRFYDGFSVWAKDKHGADVAIASGKRTKEKQAALYAKGRTAPGEKVTWTMDSKHLAGDAMDLASGDYTNKKANTKVAKLMRQYAKENPEYGAEFLPFSKDPNHIQFSKLTSKQKKADTPDYVKIKDEELPRVTAAEAVSVSPEQVAIQEQRVTRAEALREPIQLTEGQKTRTFAQQQFERETAKQAELGAPLRQRFQDQNEAIIKNFDTFVDMTKSELSDLKSVGGKVDKAIQEMATRDKNAIRVAYKNAEKSAEGNKLVTLEGLVEHLNESVPETLESGVLKVTRARLKQMGAATESEQGILTPTPITLKDANQIRVAINNATDMQAPNIRQATIMKKHIDTVADLEGGSLYKKARELRTEFANKYENISLVRDIIGKKLTRGDRKIALEDVFKKSIISGSADDISKLKKLLMTSGGEGKQAWRELQGATLRHIKSEATKNVARDERGNPIVSAAQLDRTIKTLDKGGKLDIILGKKVSREVKLLNDISKDILTVPPGAVNTSNTSSAILAAMDIAISGTAGVPAPILSGVKMIRKYMNDKKVVAKVNAALRNITEKDK